MIPPSEWHTWHGRHATFRSKDRALARGTGSAIGLAMHLRRPLLRFVFSTGIAAAALAPTACGGGAGTGFPAGEVDNGFESDDPSGQTAASRSGSSSSGGAADGGAAAPSASEGASDSEGAQRVVQEADIIKVDGNRLYALSQYGGLTVVDITNPDQMKLLGHLRTQGMPFEMYVEAGKAFVMLNDFGRYVRDDASPYGRWVQSSEILTIDVTNPAALSELAHFDVPGAIADSRMVGDVAYVVTYENGSCWGCQEKPATIVSSFKVGAAITKADQLVYSANDASFQGWQRSVSATNQRLYIAGRDWGWRGGTENAGSIIQVVDVSDPSGKLVKGTDLRVAGAITSRWQMDEYQGVLRVVSQSGGGGWGNSGINPKVQTYTVTSSQSITPLGSTDLVLPKPESLRSVRFDGTRGYAITAEQRWNIVCDPLFTIDLSNPAAPKQMGELEMPGWVFHIEPRGDRLIAFGYDDIDASRAKVAVSIFDVSGDMSKPTLLKRVAFGQGWSQLTEDQDRIHKAVRILDDQGLILVPFTSSPRWSNDTCEKAESGIQLVDFTRDDLTLRGIARSYGMPRRAFVANQRLFAMSDRNVASFDIGSRDAPVKKHDIDLSNPAYRLAELPSHFASVTSDWASGEAMLSLTPKANADDAAITGKISLASLAPQDGTTCGRSGSWASWYEARLFAKGSTVYVTLPVRTTEQVPNEPGAAGTRTKRGGKLVVAAIDATDPTKPTLLGKAESTFDSREDDGGWGWGGMWSDGWSLYSYYGGSSGSLVGSGQQIVQVGAKLAYLETGYESVKVADSDAWNGWRYLAPIVHRRLHVLDFANPSAPLATTPIELPASLGSSPLHVLDGKVLTSRWVQSPTNPDKVKFYVDRVDLTGSPVELPSINTPGSLLLVDPLSSRFATADYHATRTPASDYAACSSASSWRGFFDYENKLCIEVTRDFKLVDVDATDGKVSLRQTFELPSQNIAGVQVADDRIYITRYKRYDYSAAPTYREDGSYVYTEPKVLEHGGLWAIGGIRSGNLSIVSEMIGDAEWPLAAHGTKVALYAQNGIAIWDTATPKPTLVREVDLRGSGYSSHVLMSNSGATCSLGEYGLQTITY